MRNFPHPPPKKPQSQRRQLAARLSAPVGQWAQICLLLRRSKDVEQYICEGCGKGKLVDKNRKPYFVHRNMTLDFVQDLVNKIREINNDKLCNSAPDAPKP